MLERPLIHVVAPLVGGLTPPLVGVLPALMPPSSTSVFVRHVGRPKFTDLAPQRQLGRMLRSGSPLALPSFFGRPAISLGRTRPAPSPLETLARFVDGARHLASSGSKIVQAVFPLAQEDSPAVLHGPSGKRPLVVFSQQGPAAGSPSPQDEVRGKTASKPHDPHSPEGPDPLIVADQNLRSASGQPDSQGIQEPQTKLSFAPPQREALDPRQTGLSPAVTQAQDSIIQFPARDDTAGFPIFNFVSGGDFSDLQPAAGIVIQKPARTFVAKSAGPNFDGAAQSKDVTPQSVRLPENQRPTPSRLSGNTASPSGFISVVPVPQTGNAVPTLSFGPARTARSAVSVRGSQAETGLPAAAFVDLRAARPPVAETTVGGKPDSLYRIAAVSASSKDSDGSPEGDGSQHPDQQ